MNQRGHKPLERKPLFFEKEGKLNVISDHIEEIKAKASMISAREAFVPEPRWQEFFNGKWPQ